MCHLYQYAECTSLFIKVLQMMFHQINLTATTGV